MLEDSPPLLVSRLLTDSHLLLVNCRAGAPGSLATAVQDMLLSKPL